MEPYFIRFTKELVEVFEFKKALIWHVYFMLVACIAPVTAEEHRTAYYNIEIIASGLDHPFSFAFLPNEVILVTEKTGNLRIIKDTTLLDKRVSGVPQVNFNRYEGLMSIARHPRFAENQLLYLSLTKASHGISAGYVIRGKYSDGVLQDIENIYIATPLSSASKPIFFGGKLLFLPDETLLLTIGGVLDFKVNAQKLDSTLGKIVRITDSGKVPTNNPLIDRPDTRHEIYSYGHRNILGLVYDADGEVIYAAENSAFGGDELNVIHAGKNYGWPIATYGRDYSGAYTSPFQTYPGMESPLIQWTPSPAPSGLTQCKKCQWPEWEGDLFAGMLAGKHIKRIRLKKGLVVAQETLFSDLDERIRDVQFGSDGALYILTESSESAPVGKLLKVTPK